MNPRALRADSLPSNWHATVEWLWRQDDATPSEDTAQRAWRRLFGDTVPRGGSWGEAGGAWIAVHDKGDACSYVDELGRVLLSSYPGASRIGILPRSPASDLPRVVTSGGQTGVDRGALDAALEVGVPIGGWAPRGWRAEDGQVPERYRTALREHDLVDYMARTRDNVEDSDGVLIVSSSDELSTGTLRTYRHAEQIGRPRLQVVVSTRPDARPDPDTVRTVVAWLYERRVGVLCVAGPRESRDPGIGEAARALLVEVLSETRRWSVDSPSVRCRACGDATTEEGCPSCPHPDDAEDEAEDEADVGGPTLDGDAPGGAPPPRSASVRWDPDQEEAIRQVGAWMRSRDPSQQVFRLFGYAGTGKTTIARHLAAQSGRPWLFAAYTGKAALVMRQRGCAGACTIHSLIYRPDQEQEGDDVSFRLVGDSPLREAAGVIVDEASMVDEPMARDLLSFGRRVLVLGDPAQLPPISGGGFFTDAEADVLLTRVHRQARESGILDLATFVREGGDLIDRNGWSAPDCEVRPRSSLHPADVMRRMVDADQVIVGVNRTRRLVNGRYRAASGVKTDLPIPGDKLVCLRNQRRAGLFNGSAWRVDAAEPAVDGRTVRLELTSIDGTDAASRVEVRSWTHHFLGRYDEIESMGHVRMAYQEFDFAYALTCHKAQGSQWDDVVVLDESGSFREHARRWLYTAITRASKSLLVLT